MPPSLDVYGLTRCRDRPTIQQFLDEYVDQRAIENRGDEELMLLPLEARDESNWVDNYDWEPAVSLEHIVQRGLDHPCRSFTVYLPPKQVIMEHAILSFTMDDQLILGLSIDDEGMRSENQQLAERLLEGLAHNYGCYLGLVAVEQPPPGSERDFQNQAQDRFTVSFHSFPSRN